VADAVGEGGEGRGRRGGIVRVVIAVRLSALHAKRTQVARAGPSWDIFSRSALHVLTWHPHVHLQPSLPSAPPTLTPHTSPLHPPSHTSWVYMSHFAERLGEEALLLSQDPLTKPLSVHFTFFCFPSHQQTGAAQQRPQHCPPSRRSRPPASCRAVDTMTHATHSSCQALCRCPTQ
jgi:hypothetical protein